MSGNLVKKFGNFISSGKTEEININNNKYNIIINFIAQSYSSGELKCSRCGRLGGSIAQCY